MIRFEHVSKRYRLTIRGDRSLREEIAAAAWRLAGGARVAAPGGQVQALDDVSFTVERGETVGLIGPNGSGKSTILKLLAQVVYPTSGRIAVDGTVASLIEVGAGFHPELSGRDNIYQYGIILGLRRAEVQARFDRIVEFAELRRFLETPVKRYSSGMFVRLGFAVAAHVNPDVLLVDEVLAVGDAAFRIKCLRRIEELREAGTTIVYVSHDTDTVQRLCDRVLLLEDGRIREQGDPRTVVSAYHRAVLQGMDRSNGQIDQDRALADPTVPGAARIVEIRLLDAAGAEVEVLRTGETLRVQVVYAARRPLEDPLLDVFLRAPGGLTYSHLSTAQADEPLQMPSGEGVVELTCDALGLGPGVFTIEATLSRRDTLEVYARSPREKILTVKPRTPVKGLFYSPHHWRMLPPEPDPR